jgi:ubiquinone/menaquinone biosynthesis C-methylase UbiE
MALKERLKKLIGGTFIWRFLCIAKFHTQRALRKITPFVPKRIMYRLLQTPFFYGEDYFDKPKDPLQESGYGDVYADIGEFQQVAELSRELFAPKRVLDVGCAKGFQVGALHSRGMEAWGIDISEYAVETAPTDISTWLKVGTCTDIAFPAQYFDLVLVLETLEHVPPIDISKTMRELRRVARRWVWASIPSLGSNPYGPNGINGGKVGDEYLPLYEDNVIDLVPFKHLYTDANGIPIHGHLAMASFDWWTSVFNQHGFIRRGDKERIINRDLDSAREGIWNCTAFEKVGNPAGAKGEPMTIISTFLRTEDGAWESEPVSLPRGLHRLDLKLGITRAARGGPAVGRLIHCLGVSAEGSRINASRLINRKEMCGISRRKALDIPMLCCSGGEEEIRFRIECEGGLEVEPSPLSEVYLYASV